MSEMLSDDGEDRRSFVLRLAGWAAVLVGAALIHPLLRFTGFAIAPKPRRISVSAPLPRSGFHAEREFILFAGPTKVDAWAVSRTCTHLGCRVNFLEDKQLIECPCHQSRFTPQGQRIAGPAKRDLPIFAVEVQKDETGAVVGYVVVI